MFEGAQSGDVALFPSRRQCGGQGRPDVMRRIPYKLGRESIDAAEGDDRVDGLDPDVRARVVQPGHQLRHGLGAIRSSERTDREQAHPSVVVVQACRKRFDHVGLSVARESVGDRAPDLRRRVRHRFAQRSHRGFGKGGWLGRLPAPHGNETQPEQGVCRLRPDVFRIVLQEWRDRRGDPVGGQLAQGLDRAGHIVGVVAVQ